MTQHDVAVFLNQLLGHGDIGLQVSPAREESSETALNALNAQQQHLLVLQREKPHYMNNARRIEQNQLKLFLEGKKHTKTWQNEQVLHNLLQKLLTVSDNSSFNRKTEAPIWLSVLSNTPRLLSVVAVATAI